MCLKCWIEGHDFDQVNKNVKHCKRCGKISCVHEFELVNKHVYGFESKLILTWKCKYCGETKRTKSG